VPFEHHVVSDKQFGLLVAFALGSEGRQGFASLAVADKQHGSADQIADNDQAWLWFLYYQPRPIARVPPLTAHRTVLLFT